MITVAEGVQDLAQWLAQDAVAIEGVRNLNGGGGWEQWSVIQFLRWQLGNRHNLDYQREWKSPQVRRSYDIVYNVTQNDANHPIIVTQWKCGNDGNNVSMEVTKDIGTLIELGKRGVYPVLLILCAQNVNFGGVGSSGQIPGTTVRLYYSTDATWKAYGGF
jgi:hypothetical protein